MLPRWKPRDGRNDAYIKWYDALINLESDLDVDIELDEKQPSYQQLATRYTPTDLANSHILDIIAQAAEQWQSDSNLLFDVIKNSLVLDGPHLERDLRKISSFVSLKHKDARSLRAWALSFADLSSIDNQMALRTKLNEMKLDAMAAYPTLEKHCREFWASWSLVAGNDTSRDGLETFYMQLLSTLPSQPEGAHLTNVRKWLADKITESSPMLNDVDNTIDTLLKYATVIGLSQKQLSVVAGTRAGTAPLDPNSLEARTLEHARRIVAHHDTQQSASYNKSTLHALTLDTQDTEQVNAMAFAKASKCDFCDCYSCESRDRGGIDKCICRWDSAFDLARTSFSDATKGYITKLRAYHKQNRTVSTLKGVKFTRGATINSLMTLDDLFGENSDEAAIEDWLQDISGERVTMLNLDADIACNTRPLTPKQTYRQMLYGTDTRPLTMRANATIIKTKYGEGGATDPLTSGVVRIRSQDPSLQTPLPMRPLSNEVEWQLVPPFALKLASPLRGLMRERLASAKTMLTRLDEGASRILLVAIFLGLGPQLKGLLPELIRVITRKIRMAYDANRVRLLSFVRMLMLAIQRRLTAATPA